MKSFSKLYDEFAAVNRKQDIRAMRREKELYTYWRNRKLFSIERARECKKLGMPELQLRWQHRAAECDELAKQAKAYIRQLGGYIYK